MKLHMKKGFLAGVIILLFLLSSHSYLEGLTYNCLKNTFRFRDPTFATDSVGWRLPSAPNRDRSGLCGPELDYPAIEMEDLLYIASISSTSPGPVLHIQSSKAPSGIARDGHGTEERSILPGLMIILPLGIGFIILWLWLHTFKAGADTGKPAFLNRELFLYILDLELKRARRYQKFFSVLKLKLSPLYGQQNGERLQECYQSLTRCLRGELRAIDVLGSLGDDQLAALLLYTDPSGTVRVKSRLEDRFKYIDFKKYGYEVRFDQICFPKEGTGTKDLVRKVTEIEVLY